MTDESKISKRYRELGREEPPRALDDAILAKSRRAVEARPAPLVVPTGRRRWYFPLAAAAIIVLAVAVTVHVERQQPDAEAVMQADTAPPVPPAERQKPETAAAPAPQAVPPKAGAKREEYVPDPKPAPAQEQRAAPLADLQKAPSAAPAPASPPGARESEVQERKAMDGLASRRDEASQPQAQPAPSPSTARARVQSAPAPAAKPGPPPGRAAEAMPTLGSVARESPEQWLQGIVDLRRQGRHEEADKALAEFRRAYPDYRISEAMLEKVEKK